VHTLSVTQHWADHACLGILEDGRLLPEAITLEFQKPTYKGANNNILKFIPTLEVSKMCKETMQLVSKLDDELIKKLGTGKGHDNNGVNHGYSLLCTCVSGGSYADKSKGVSGLCIGTRILLIQINQRLKTLSCRGK
jgi:hypothetical protein